MVSRYHIVVSERWESHHTDHSQHCQRLAHEWATGSCFALLGLCYSMYRKILSILEINQASDGLYLKHQKRQLSHAVFMSAHQSMYLHYRDRLERELKANQDEVE